MRVSRFREIMQTDQNREAEHLEAEIVSQISSLANPSTANVRNFRRGFSKRISKQIRKR